MDFRQLNENIGPSDPLAARQAQARWDAIAKPVGSLGLLEKNLVRIAALTGSPRLSLTPRSVLVMCSDNGVASPEIAITPVKITKIVAEMMARKQSNVCRMAKLAGAEVLPFDVGMFSRSSLSGLTAFHLADGTGNILTGPAMSRKQALELIEFGIEQARLRAKSGDRLLATGEMGVGNTTTSAALTSALLKLPPAAVTGRGSGLSDEGLQTKINVIERALALNAPSADDPLDALAKVGGFDLAALCGVFLGAALYRVPVLIDGVISAAAAYAAYRLCPNAQKAMIATHMTAEPAGKALFNALGLSPMICAEMRLGEGTGAVAAMPLLDMALEIYTHMLTFEEIGMEAPPKKDEAL